MEVQERKCPKVKRNKAQERTRVQIEKGSQLKDNAYDVNSNEELEFEVRLPEEQKIENSSLQLKNNMTIIILFNFNNNFSFSDFSGLSAEPNALLCLEQAIAPLYKGTINSSKKGYL